MTWSRFKDALFVTCFVAMISVPAVAGLLGVEIGPEVFENRVPAKFPRFDSKRIEKTIKGFEKYYNDNFGLRNLFLFSNKALKYFLLQTPGSNLVLVGGGGWHFYRQRPNLEEVRNAKPFTQEQLEKWGRAFQLRSDVSKKWGATYLLVIAPEARTIFPEELPDWVPPPLEKSRMDQLYEYLAAHTDVQFLDLRPMFKRLKEAEERDKIYYRTDTHWTELGGYYAYREIMLRLQQMNPQFAKDLEPIPLSSFEVQNITYSGDLAVILGLKGLITEDTVRLEPRYPWKAQVRKDKRSHEKDFVMLNPERPNAPRLLIFRDSFVYAFQSTIAEHFSFSRFRWTYSYERKHLPRDRPNIVVQLMVERTLHALKPRAFEG